MEKRGGGRNLDRYFSEPPVQVGTMTTESHGRHLYPNPPDSSIQNPFFVETDPNQTLEGAFSRLNLSAYPPNRSLCLLPGLDGGIVDGSVVGDHENGYMNGGEGFWPLSVEEIEQTNTELWDLGFQNNGSLQNNGFGAVGYMGLQDYGHCQMVGEFDYEDWENFHSASYPTSVVSENFLNGNGFSRDSAEGHGRHNHSPRRLLQRGEVINGSPIIPRSHKNKLLRDSTVDSCGVLGGFVSKDTNDLRSSLYNPRLQQPLNYVGLGDLRGRIVSLATDQYGCRFLQMKFDGIKDEEIQMIFSEVIGHVGELMLDQFGNYLVQKLVEVCNEEQRTRILLSVTKNKFQLVSICLNMHGTRAVQKLLEHLTTPQQISLVMSALSPGAVALTKDMNGHHVIQHCLKHFSNEDNKYLLSEVANNSWGIATDKSGCCVLQSCVEHSQGEPRERLVAEIISNALLLAEDRYGNYVVQHIVGLRIPRVTAKLLKQLGGSYFSLSCNKYGSNVVEKCLIESGEELSRQIIMELLRSPNVSMLLVDPFGNYVIQSALSVSKT
ncbi:hypothetical protein L1049_025904 [Liquidambar formosana]|uniref:PUM-HD domain-containing protein n=1 Tax=Liquidambar formosana TaxID=63359 RepID=A0AAP0NDP8_LIQFO